MNDSPKLFFILDFEVSLTRGLGLDSSPSPNFSRESGLFNYANNKTSIVKDSKLANSLIHLLRSCCKVEEE